MEHAVSIPFTGLRSVPLSEQAMNNRILFVDDEKNVLVGYQRALRGKYRIDTASSAREALELVDRSGPYAVVVTDMQMPGMNGMQLLASLKACCPDTVRMMVTGNADQKTAVAAVNQGEVYRFLNKPCEREQLVEALGEGLVQYDRTLEEQERLARSVADLDVLTQRLSYESRHDFLTGLYNRHAFEEGLRQCLETMLKQFDGMHSLCHLDLDHFHVVNDTCGHVAGDAMLRTIGDLLSSHCRVNDLVGRMAGDEFAILLFDCTTDQAKLVVEKICRAIEQMSFEWEGRHLDMRASAGLVSLSGSVADTATLLSAAETACHVALELGGGQLHVAGPQDDQLTKRLSQAQWVSKISSALREDRFCLFAQRIVPIGNSSAGDHCELLIRMLDDEGRPLLPGAFLDAAERFHLSPQIDRWVVNATARWLANNPRQLAKLSLCSINLSGHSIGNSELLELIKQVFVEGGLPPAKLCFEITETAAIAKMHSAVHFIQELREMGFKFALDDFGSGLSSFGYLKNLPVDFLKIDGMFVKQIDTDPVDRAMVRCINEVAKLMGKQTIAEYVENERILQILKEIGVDFAQGYHIAKPCPLEEFMTVPAG